ncbi:hypothetical protein GCM10023334_027570 [Nonomuraea thailandensis]
MGGEVLQDGRASGVADEFSHPPTVSFSPLSPDTFADYLSETALPQVEISPEGGSWLSGERSPNGHLQRRRNGTGRGSGRNEGGDAMADHEVCIPGRRSPVSGNQQETPW